MIVFSVTFLQSSHRYIMIFKIRENVNYSHRKMKKSDNKK